MGLFDANARSLNMSDSSLGSLDRWSSSSFKFSEGGATRDWYFFLTPAFFSSIMFCSWRLMNLLRTSSRLLTYHSFWSSSLRFSLSIFIWIRSQAAITLLYYYVTFVHLEDLGSDDFGYLVGRKLVDQVPQLHVRLLRALGVLESDRSFEGELVVQLRLEASQLADLLYLGLLDGLVALKLELHGKERECYNFSFVLAFVESVEGLLAHLLVPEVLAVLRLLHLHVVQLLVTEMRL
jgi:hypothetical protein